MNASAPRPPLRLPVSLFTVLVVLLLGVAGAVYLASSADKRIRAVVLKRDLAAFQLIMPGDVEVQMIKSDRRQPDIILRSDDVADRYTLFPISKGQPVASSLLGPRVDPHRLLGSVVTGLQVGENVILANRLQRGTLVDLVIAPKTAEQDKKATHIIKDVLLLDTIATQPPGSYVIVVAVSRTSQQALTNIVGSDVLAIRS